MTLFRFFLPLLIAFQFVSANPVEGVALEDLRIYGYIDLKYQIASNSQGEAIGINKEGSFDNHHFNLLLDLPVTPKLIVRGHIEFEHGVDTEKNYGSVKTEWAFFQYSFFDELKARGGKVLTPYGLFNEIRDATPVYLSVDVPQNIYTTPMRGGFDFFPEAMNGIGATGIASLYKYRLGSGNFGYSMFLGNGETPANINPAQQDYSTRKSVGGRVFYTPKDILTMGVSFYSGDRQTSKVVSYAHDTVGGDLALDLGSFNLTTEAAYSKFNGVEETAAHAQVSYTLGGLFTPYYRFEYFNPNIDFTDRFWRTHLFGLNISPLKGVAIKLEMDIHERGINNPLVTAGQTTFNEIKTAVAIAF